MRIAQIQDDGIVVRLAVHAAKAGILVQHVLLRFDAVVSNEFAGDPEPFTVHEGADFGPGIRKELLVHVLDLAGLDVQLPLEDFGRTEGTDAGLAALHGREVIGSRLLQELLGPQGIFGIRSSLHNHGFNRLFLFLFGVGAAGSQAEGRGGKDQ